LNTFMISRASTASRMSETTLSGIAPLTAVNGPSFFGLRSSKSR
jgi:hypothetical protein